MGLLVGLLTLRFHIVAESVATVGPVSLAAPADLVVLLVRILFAHALEGAKDVPVGGR